MRINGMFKIQLDWDSNWASFPFLWLVMKLTCYKKYLVVLCELISNKDTW